jgi:hypothetical protein
MDTPQIRDLVFLEIRAKLGQALLEQNVIETNDGKLGWWKDDLNFVSLYELMEAIRDQR